MPHFKGTMDLPGKNGWNSNSIIAAGGLYDVQAEGVVLIEILMF